MKLKLLNTLITFVICDLYVVGTYLFVSFIKDFLDPCKYGEDALNDSFDLEWQVNDDGKALN